MTKKGEEQKSNPKTCETKTVLIYACPRNSLCTQGGVIKFDKNTGYTNPFNHLRSCVAAGSRSDLVDIYNTCVQDRHRSAFKKFPVTLTSTSKENAMHAYITLIVMKYLPLSIVEDKSFRDFAKYDIHFNRSTVRKVLLALVKIVEERISEDLRCSKGAIMYDGWSRGGTHYVGIMAVFMRKRKSVEHGQVVQIEELAMPLLSVSPIAAVVGRDPEGNDVYQEATNFSAERHVRQFEDIFNMYGVNVHMWTLAQLTDNCSTNKLIANMMEVPHVGCLNHKLHLDIQDMVTSDSALENIITEIGKTMVDCKSKLRNRALLRNLTSLSPVTHNDTRWSSKYQMICRFNRIRTELLATADSENASVRINASNSFKLEALRYEKMLQFFDIATLELQKRGATLYECRVVIDALVESIDANSEIAHSAMFDCRFTPKRVLLKGIHSPNSHFESGVAKIQSGEVGLMTQQEKSACKNLELSSSENIPSENESECDTEHQLSRAIKNKKRKVVGGTKKYINTRFILGSSAEMERVWSIAKYVLPDNRKLMDPIIFESILFLKVNASYWDLGCVQRAMKAAKLSNEEEE